MSMYKQKVQEPNLVLFYKKSRAEHPLTDVPLSTKDSPFQLC